MDALPARCAENRLAVADVDNGDPSAAVLEQEVVVTTNQQERRECSYCKESLVILRLKYRDGASDAIPMEVATGNRHVCWNLPEDANLIVMDD